MNRLPKKVLHVLNSSSGGAALSTLGLIDSMRQQGIHACAVCHDAGTEQERQRLRDATNGDVLFTPLYWWTKKVRKPLWKRPLSEIRQLYHTGWGRGSSNRVAQFAAKHQVELIHSNTLTTPEGGIAAKQLGLPHVWHIRELVGPQSTHPIRISGQMLGRYLTEHCSKLVANSHATAEHVKDLVSPELLEIVFNGIDLSQFTPRPRDPQVRPIVVGMVANLTAHWKKHAVFVEAATRVDRSLSIEWRIYGHDPSQGGTVGGDPYIGALHTRLAQAGITDRFTWPGFVGSPVTVMDQIDILVHPADGESFGRIVVEAMAAGLPVVGVRGGGVGEIVSHGETGFLAPIDDATDFARHIETLVRDPQLRAQMGAAGRRRAEECYSLEACTSNMLRVYADALARPGRTAAHE